MKRCGSLIVGLMVIIIVLAALRAATSPKTSAPTSVAEQAAISQQAQPTWTLRPTWTPGPSATAGPPTATAAPPTATAAPTQPPGIGATTTLKDWTLSLAKIDHRAKLVWSDFGNSYKPSGVFWLVWLDAKNNANATDSLRSNFGFKLTDDHGAIYDELYTSSYNQYGLGEFIKREGRDPLDAGVTPRALTHTLLVFDVAADAQPATLTIADSALFSSDKVLFSLAKK